jgi:hypothetical protein
VDLGVAGSSPVSHPDAKYKLIGPKLPLFALPAAEFGPINEARPQGDSPRLHYPGRFFLRFEHQIVCLVLTSGLSFFRA